MLYLNVLLLTFGLITTLAAFGGETWVKGKRPFFSRITTRGWIALACLLATFGAGIGKEVMLDRAANRASEERKSLLAKILQNQETMLPYLYKERELAAKADDPQAVKEFSIKIEAMEEQRRQTVTQYLAIGQKGFEPRRVLSWLTFDIEWPDFVGSLPPGELAPFKEEVRIAISQELQLAFPAIRARQPDSTATLALTLKELRGAGMGVQVVLEWAFGRKVFSRSEIFGFHDFLPDVHDEGWEYIRSYMKSEILGRVRELLKNGNKPLYRCLIEHGLVEPIDDRDSGDRLLWDTS